MRQTIRFWSLSAGEPSVTEAVARARGVEQKSDFGAVSQVSKGGYFRQISISFAVWIHKKKETYYHIYH